MRVQRFSLGLNNLLVDKAKWVLILGVANVAWEAAQRITPTS